MLKKHNKLIVFLVLAAFMFTIVGSASAATFSDLENVTGANDILRLNSLGIIDGYTDGTFGPDKTITRAEFAKIAVATAGLKEAASGLQASPSEFKDVQPNEWHTGWINVAVAQGYFKGYPDGTFKPNQTVTQQEVITVLMRILGYNDNLEGTWPYNYIAKAVRLGITDNVAFVGNAGAPRAIVCQLASATLDEYKVQWDAEKERFDFKADPAVAGAYLTLLKEYFKEGKKVEEFLVTNYNLADNKIRLSGVNFGAGTDTTIELDANFVVAGAANWKALEHKVIDYQYIVKDNKKFITWAQVRPDYKTVAGTKAIVTAAATARKVEINDVTYDVDITVDATKGTKFDVVSAVAASAGFAANYTAAPVTAVTAGTYEADSIKVVLNKDNKVCYAKLVDLVSPGIVGTVDATNKVIRLKSRGSGTFGFADAKVDLKDKSYYVLRNGAPATLADLQAADILYNIPGKGVDFCLQAMGSAVTGTLESYKLDASNTYVTEIKVAGEAIKVASKEDVVANGTVFLLISKDDGANFNIAGTPANLDDYLGKDVKVLKSMVGRAQAIVTGGESVSSKIYGVITDITINVASADGLTHYIKLLKADGTKVTYEVNPDDSDTAAVAYVTGIGSTANADRLVAVDLLSSGVVDKIYQGNAEDFYTAKVLVNAFDTDENVVSLVATAGPLATDYAGLPTGVKFDSNVAVFDMSGAGAKTSTLTALKDSGAIDPLWFYIDNGVIKYFATAAVALTASDYQIVMEKGVDRDGTYVVLMDSAGIEVTYNIDSAATFVGSIGAIAAAGDVTKGDVIIPTFNSSKSKITNINGRFNAPAAPTAGKPTIDEVDVANKTVSLSDGTNLFINKDTVIFAINDLANDAPELLTIEDLFAGDKVEDYNVGTVTANYIIICNK